MTTSTRDWNDVIWAMTTRMDPVRDTTFGREHADRLPRLRPPVSGLGGKIGFDATNKWPGEKQGVADRRIVCSCVCGGAFGQLTDTLRLTSWVTVLCSLAGRFHLRVQARRMCATRSAIRLSPVSALSTCPRRSSALCLARVILEHRVARATCCSCSTIFSISCGDSLMNGWPAS